jgi:hypothetical protein
MKAHSGKTGQRQESQGRGDPREFLAVDRDQVGANTTAKGGDRLRIVYRAISELRLDPRNPRVHSRRQVRQIARSIEVFGFNVPVSVDANSKVIAGHGCIMAAQLLGWPEVPTICLDHLSEAQARAFMIVRNE